MKKYVMLSLATLTTSLFSLKAQTNLVQNPSFEIYDTCPKLQNEISYAVDWHHFDGTPDYFNSCSINPQFSVPNNWGGYQQAASGAAYSAFGAYLSPYYGGLHNIREFIGGTLSSSLTIGTKYYVSLKVSLSLNDTIAANCAVSKLGATFSKIQYQFVDFAPALINNNPKVYENAIIKDSSNWTRIFGSFIADSTYNYIIIGNFFDDAHTDTLILDSSEYKNCEAYYYLDDICVSTDSIYALNYSDTINNTNVREVTKFSLYDIFPNPTNKILNIQLNGQINGLATLWDITGRELMSSVSIANNSMQIDVSALSPGMYFLSIKTKDTCVIQKFIKY